MLLLGLPHIHVREGASPEPRRRWSAIMCVRGRELHDSMT